MMCGILAELPPNALAHDQTPAQSAFARAVDEAMERELTAFFAALQSDEARAAFMKFMSR